MKLTEDDFEILDSGHNIHYIYIKPNIWTKKALEEIKKEILENQRLRELVEEQIKELRTIHNNFPTEKETFCYRELQSLLNKAKGEKE